MKKTAPSTSFFSIFCTLLLFATAPINAQELPANLTDTIAIQELEALKLQKLNDDKDNLPVSETHKQQNVRDLETTNTNALESKSDKMAPSVNKNKSILNYYYEILTQEQLDIFGKDAFATDGNNKILFYNTPGDDYELAAGDVVEVITRGLSVINVESQIDNLGRLTLPIIAPFLAHGKTLSEIKEHILNELRADDASATAYVNLSAARLVQVKVTGEIDNPQTIAVPAYTPVSQIISRVGGISDLGSLRNITLTTSNQKKVKIDLYDILRDGEEFKEPLITVASRIHVNDIGSTVAVSGFVGRPKIFELSPESKRIKGKELLKLANANLTPFGTNFEILKFNNQGIVHSVKFNSIDEVYINEGEALKLSFAKTRNLEEVSVIGQVLTPFQIQGDVNGLPLYNILKGGAVLTKEALRSVALLHSKTDGKRFTKAIDLRRVFQNELKVTVFPGDSIEILSEKSYKDILKFSKQDFFIRQTTEIFLDDKRIALIPEYPKQNLKDTINSLSQIVLSDTINKDFAYIISSKDTENEQIKTINLGHALKNPTPEYIENNTKINLFTKSYLTSLLQNFNIVLSDNDILMKIKNSEPVQVYLDGNLISIVPADQNFNQTGIAKIIASNDDIYKYFVRVLEKDEMGRTKRSQFHLKRLLSETDKFKIAPGQKIELMSNKFISDLFTDSHSQTNSTLEVLDNSAASIEIDSNAVDLNQIGINSNQKQNSIAFKSSNAALKRASKRVAGAVDRPGYYPIAEEISLGDLISLAGGMLTGADTRRLTVRQYEATFDGKLKLSDTTIVDSNTLEISKFYLSGFFDVYIPSIINDAATGSVELTGEALRPGTYIISRGETLADLIARTGGLSNDAYPLGASFFRQSIKEEEKAANIRLAEKIERLITLTPSDSEDAAGQIKAVLGYTSQLRSLPVTGRQSISSLDEKIRLVNGDVIHIPPTPTHVNVSGLVQNPIATQYEPNKMLADYIEDAGGFDNLADTKNVYLQLPNGSSLRIDALDRHGGIIPAGSAIVVPPKTDKISVLGLTEVFSKILGNIATSILAINAVSN